MIGVDIAIVLGLGFVGYIGWRVGRKKWGGK